MMLVVGVHLPRGLPRNRGDGSHRRRGQRRNRGDGIIETSKSLFCGRVALGTQGSVGVGEGCLHED